jgi:hypothetical protein
MTRDEHTANRLKGERIARNFETRERERATTSTAAPLHPKLRMVLQARARRLYAPRGRTFMTVADGVPVAIRPDGTIMTPNGRIP